jgi:hypothetical protein
MRRLNEPVVASYEMCATAAKYGLRSNALKALALAVIATTALIVRAPASLGAYPQMAFIDQYLMKDKEAEISMARSTAPETISRDATVLVFGKSGYETAVEGKNGFTCLVERSWMNPFDSPGFWNAKMRGPFVITQQRYGQFFLTQSTEQGWH